MIGPVSMANVSNVHFKGDQELLAREGAFAKKAPEAQAATPEAAEKKSNTGKKFAIGAVVVAAALATLAVLSRQKILNVLPEAKLADLNWYSPEKIGHYLAKAGDKLATWIYDPLKGLLKGKAAKEAVDTQA